MSFCHPNCQKWTILVISVVSILLGVLTVVLWNDLYTAIKNHELNLGSKSTTEYKMWKKTPIPMYIEFYMFDWVNHQEVVNSKWKIKPKFEERGPYTYSEVHIRENITFNHNHTITFKTQRIWHYVPELSNGTLDDKITTINTILATVGDFVKNKHAIVRMGVNFFLQEKRVNLTVTKTVREFLFDGYDDPMLTLMHKLNMSGINVPFEKFGWFYGRNESIDYDGTFNMYDGTNGLDKLGLITSWNFDSDTKDYPGECGLVKGTSGELWYPVGNASQVKIFASDSCSTMTLVRDGEDELHGVKGHKYAGNEMLYDNGTKYPQMECFSYGESFPSGVRNVSKCKFNAPALISNPHFYLADPFYLEPLEGIHPDKNNHEFFISIEPETGIPVQVQAAVQINIRIQPIPRITLLEGVKDIVLPTMWFKQTAKLSEELASQAKLLLVLPVVGEYTGYGVVAIGCLLLLVAGYITIRKGWDWRGGTPPEETLLNQDAL